MASNYFGHGAAAFPVAVPANPEDLAKALDPGAYAIANLLKAAINAELAGAWLAVLSAVGLDNAENSPLFPVTGDDGPALPVMDTMLQSPDSGALQQGLHRWPLLAVYRMGDPKTTQHTLYQELTAQQWAVDWIVGPLDALESEMMGLLAGVVAGVIRTTIHLGYHAAFEAGTRQFYGQFFDIKSIDTQGPGRLRVASTEGDSGFFAITVVLLTRETTVITDGNSIDTTFKHYPAFTAPRAEPLPTASNEFIVNYDNKTPDPEV